MRLLVCGPRAEARQRHVWRVLDLIHADTPISLLITGGAPGLDTLADQWGEDRGIDRAIFPANWKGRGKPAGPIRNARMLRIALPDLVLAFHSTGPGTADMIRQALKAGVPVAKATQPEESG